MRVTTTGQRGTPVNGHLLTMGTTMVFFPHCDKYGPERLMIQHAKITLEADFVWVSGFVNTGVRDLDGNELFVKIHKSFTPRAADSESA